MAYWIENYFASLIISVLLAGLIIPKILLIAFRKKLFDDIDERKVHKGVVPRLGGIAFMPSFIFSFFLVTGFNIRQFAFGVSDLVSFNHVPIMFLLCSLMLMYLCGIADDLIGVRYRAKFVLQIFAAVLLLFSGMWIRDLDGFAGIGNVNQWVGMALTVLFVIYVINAINLIDGIDGLASGLSAVALLFYSFVFFNTGQYIYFLLAGATLGTLIPFFYYNVFGRAESHNKIFMGDTGALTIGTMLAFLSLKVLNTPMEDYTLSGNKFVLAISPIILPCFDVLRVFIHRVRNKKNPFLPDKCHIHHKLLALGFPQWQALVLILVLDCIFIGINMILASMMNATLLITVDILLWTGFNMMLTMMIRSRERVNHVQLYE